MKTFHARLFGALFIATLGTSVTAASAAPANAELVSRADGPAGQPFVGPLVDATRDGRFVLFGARLLVRDRTAQTTTPVFSGTQPVGLIESDLTDDGQRVLYRAPSPDGNGLDLRVHDIVAGSDALVADHVQPYARFTSGGTGVVYTQASGIYSKNLPSGSPVLLMADAFLDSATASGNVITWHHLLLADAKPPVTAVRGAVGGFANFPYGWPAYYTGASVGYLVRGGTPQVAARTTVVERLSDATDTCLTSPHSGALSVKTTPLSLTIDDSGSHLWLTTTRTDSGDTFNPPGTYTTSLQTRTTTGTALDRTFGPPVYSFAAPATKYASFTLQDIGETGNAALLTSSTVGTNNGTPLTIAPATGATPSELPPFTNVTPGRVNTGGARYFAHDAGLLRDENNQFSTDPFYQGVYAYNPVSPAPAPQPSTFTAGPDDVASTDLIQPSVTWASCPGAAPTPLPIGTAAQYAAIAYDTPFSSSKSAGTVTVNLMPTGVHAAARVRLAAKIFGFTIWSELLDTDQTLVLPKPLRYIPVQFSVDVEVPGDAGGAATHLLQRRTIQTWN